MSMAHDFGHDLPPDEEIYFDLPEHRESFEQFCARMDFNDAQKPDHVLIDLQKKLRQRK